MSDMVPMYGFGGGGDTALNLAVVGGTAQPANPKEHTIWVNTDAEIAGWIIAPSQPDNPAEGMVFMKTDTRSAIVCNVLKKNAILLTPIAAKQYIGGAWVDKEAGIYQGGAWQDFIDWSKWIVKEGLANPSIEAEGKGAGYNESIPAASTVSLTEDSGSLKIVVTGNSGGSSMVYFGKVDLSDANSVTLKGSFQIHPSYPTYYQLVVWSEIGTYQTQNMLASVVIGETGGALDTSALMGAHYVGLMTRGTGTHYITNIYMDAAGTDTTKLPMWEGGSY